MWRKGQSGFVGKHHTSEAIDKIREASKGRRSWCKGLTKETDTRVANSANKHIGKSSWNKGITIDRTKYPNFGHQHSHTQESIELMKESHKGKIPWNKGLTKETDSRVEAISNSLKGNQSNIGHICSQETKDKIGLRNKGIKHDEAFSQMCVDRQKKLCKDPKYIEMRIEAMLKANIEIRPNKPEKKVMSIVEQEFLDFKYTGDGSFWIQGKNPDFINVNGRKQIIEVLGCYWHGCLEHFPDEKKYKEFEDRVRLFKSYGYSTLGIWEHELKHPEKVIERIQEFVER